VLRIKVVQPPLKRKEIAQSDQHLPFRLAYTKNLYNCDTMIPPEGWSGLDDGDEEPEDADDGIESNDEDDEGPD
jgi:hypothetical protein